MEVSLQSVDFADAAGEPLAGLVPVASPVDGLSPDEASVIRQAATFPDVTFVFFRRFSDGRSSQPAVFVVDNEVEHLDNETLAKLHNDLWLHGMAPLVYVAWPIRAQDREPEREYVDRESHFVWGRRCLLVIAERDDAPCVVLKYNKLHFGLQPGTPAEKRHAIAEAWYREQVRLALPDLMAKWQPVLGIAVTGFYVQRMRTRWGSCIPASRTIRLNTDLAKKPRECLEYVVVHELVHLLEPSHNARFVALMNRYLPRWQDHRKALNRLPVRHKDWEY